MHNTLKEIIAQKHLEIAQLKILLVKNPDSLLAKIMSGECLSRKIKSLKKALTTPQAIIAEIKRASPAKGVLADIVDPAALAHCYQQAGAVAISVLTDEKFFKGSINDLQQVSTALENTACVILRKEFILDEVQIAQSAEHGADAILLILAATGDRTEALMDYAYYLGLEVLLEVHTRAELDYALEIEAPIIGINNRNLKTLTVDLNTSLELVASIPDTIIAVAESGILDAATAQHLFAYGFDALLVGEALVRAADPGGLLQAMRAHTDD